MKLVESILTKNPCYTAGRKIEVKGLMLHSVGCSQPKASVFIGNWNSPEYDRACVHAFIDGNDGSIFQTLPWDHRGWHCGKGSKGSGNNSYIGVEMCEPACIEYTEGSSFICYDREAAMAVVKRTYDAAVELFAYLCAQYGLDPLADGVILSHSEGHGRGIASNHADPEHLWRGLSLGYTMNGFRRAVKAAMNDSGKKEEQLDSGGEVEWYRVRKSWADSASQKGAYKKLGNAKRCADGLVGYSVFDSMGNVVYVGKQADRSYTVEDGDNLWKIAENELGDGTRYPEIMALNGLDSDTIYAGQILKLPE
ncbi:MAG: N-acetylmuramoyl-L-alanine amidase [Lachnospiraceae bacterium]|nr:N-acetylmuramoyl-L-alanine amidase [Lachnospiraceae bacterium]